MATDSISFHLEASDQVIGYDTLALSHPGFPQVYYMVRNANPSLTATLETGETVTFNRVPTELEWKGERDDLDVSLDIRLGDVGEIAAAEIESLRLAGLLLAKPTLTYRSFRSDDLSAPMDGPISLQVSTPNVTAEGATFTAEVQRLNTSGSGQRFTTARFVMMKAFQ